MEKGIRKQTTDKNVPKVWTTELITFNDNDKMDDPTNYKKLIVYNGLDSYFGNTKGTQENVNTLPQATNGQGSTTPQRGRGGRGGYRGRGGRGRGGLILCY